MAAVRGMTVRMQNATATKIARQVAVVGLRQTAKTETHVPQKYVTKGAAKQDYIT
jgi:hypothetical protein